MGQMANQMLLEWIYMMKEKLQEKKDEKNKSQEKTQKEKR